MAQVKMLRKASLSVKCSSTQNTSNRGKTLELMGILFKRGCVACDVRFVHGLRIKSQEGIAVELAEGVGSEESKPAQLLKLMCEHRHQFGNLLHIMPPLLQPWISMWRDLMSSVQCIVL
eukprot:14179191-Heterocapsa_arctica.AAC.1